MLYMHDVWVNWFEGQENAYNVCYFHEWRKEDKIELLDQVPLLYITKNLYNHIENDMQDLPKTLLDMIYKRGYVRKGQERTVLEYVCIVTDGNDMIVFDTIGYTIPIRKSRLIPRQEQMVYEMIRNTKPKNIPYDKPIYKKEYHILSMPPKYVHGLTRRERQLKQLLMMSLDQLKTANNLEELRYWLTEWDPKEYESIRCMIEEEVWNRLYNGVKIGWTDAHEDLCFKLIKGQPFLEKMWENENDQDNLISRQKSRNQ